jgi:hypothetical protein
VSMAGAGLDSEQRSRSGWGLEDTAHHIIAYHGVQGGSLVPPHTRRRVSLIAYHLTHETRV